MLLLRLATQLSKPETTSDTVHHFNTSVAFGVLWQYAMIQLLFSVQGQLHRL
jgi:hypothetical protein